MTSDGFELLKDIGIAIFVVDESGRFLWANRAFAGLTGRSEADLLGKRIDAVFRTELKKGLKIINEAVEKGTCACDYGMLTLPRAAGEVVKFDLTASPVQYDGKAILVCLWDMAKHARTDELREEYSKKLEMEVRKRTEELQEKANELENFYRLAVGRELKMVELKEKIKELEDKPRSK